MKNSEKRWEKFCFSNIFDIKNGFYNKKPEGAGNGTIPFLGAVDNNNGVTEYYTIEEIEAASKTGDLPNASLDKKIFKGKCVCVTNNGSVGFAFYQPEEFTCSHDVNPLYIKDGEFNVYTGLFVSTVIMHDRYRWDYGRKWRPKRMKFSEISLPIKTDENGNAIIDCKKKYSEEGYIPDWEYMEEYIKNIHHKPITTSVKASVKQLDERIWKPFLLTDIFRICRGNGLSKVELTESNSGICYVSRQSYNNGVNTKVDSVDNIEPFPSGAITVALGGEYLGASFVQKEPFYTGAHMAILVAIDEKMSLLSKLFICTLIRFEAKIKYCAFGRELDTHIDKEFSVKLPVIEDDSPDWDWIDSYMESLPNSDRLL